MIDDCIDANWSLIRTKKLSENILQDLQTLNIEDIDVFSNNIKQIKIGAKINSIHNVTIEYI